MYPILLAGLLGLFFTIERFLYFFVEFKKVPKKIEALCNARGDASGDASLEDSNLRARVALAIDAEIGQLSRFVSTLGTLSSVATLLGLLGTVTGNISAFKVLSSAGYTGDPASLAASIGQALLTTAFGLAVSIPLLIAYNFFVSRIAHETSSLEQLAGKKLLESQKK